MPSCNFFMLLGKVDLPRFRFRIPFAYYENNFYGRFSEDLLSVRYLEEKKSGTGHFETSGSSTVEYLREYARRRWKTVVIVF